MARDFDGIDDRIPIGATNIATTGSSTTIVVHRPDNTGAAYQSVLTNSTGTENGWRCDSRGGTNVMAFTKQGLVDISSTLALTNGTWYALAWRHIVTTEVVFYRKEITSTTISQETVANTTAINSGAGAVIGSRIGDEAVALDGALALVLHYNADIGDTLTQLILSANGLYIHPANLSLHMHLWGLSAESDWSGNNNHSTSIVGTTVIDHPPGISAVWLAPHPRLSQVAAAAAAGADGGGPRTFAAFVPGFP